MGIYLEPFLNGVVGKSRVSLQGAKAAHQSGTQTACNTNFDDPSQKKKSLRSII
jgi:hypothetical protein